MAKRMIAGLFVALALGVAVVAPAGGLFGLSTGGAASTRTLTIGMGYYPSVQFAPYYVALDRGYYSRAGLQITFNYEPSPNLMEMVAAGSTDLANADGTDAVVAAAGQHIPIRYVMAEYQRFPVAIFALASSGIKTIKDLRGKTVGVPGLYGATYVGLLAALHVAGVPAGAVHIEAIGYTQTESVAAHKVDAAVGYSVNEPVILQREGYKVNTIQVSSVANLVPAGVVAGAKLIKSDPQIVRAFIQATLHGLADTIANPQAAFAIAQRIGHLNLHGRDVANQNAVLQQAIAFWHGAATKAHGLGYVDPAQWTDSVTILKEIGLLPRTASSNGLFTNAFVAGAAHV